VDVIESVPSADVAKLKQNPKFKIEQTVSWRTIFWQMDQSRDNPPFVTDKAGKPLGKNPFKDARVRAAISKALNRDAIVSRIMEGLAVPASSIVSPQIFGHPGTKPTPTTWKAPRSCWPRPAIRTASASRCTPPTTAI
jgi:peptide/nickel transport system substrate-binding protein